MVWVGFVLFPRLGRNTLESTICTIQNKYNSNSRTMGGKKIRGEKERLWNAYLRSRADLMRNALALLNEYASFCNSSKVQDEDKGLLR